MSELKAFDAGVRKGLKAARAERQHKAPITLPCGTVVQQFPEPNGSWYVRVLPDDREMTEAEWQEFCAIIRPDPVREGFRLFRTR